MKKCMKFGVAIILAMTLIAMCVMLVACNLQDDALRFAAPDGTPALAMLRLASQKQKIGDYEVDYDVVSPSNIAIEMGSGKADIVIMPINAGAAQIVNQQAGYKLVSVAVEGSLYLLGHKDVEGSDVALISLDDIKGKKVACIGETGVPGLVFRYVLLHNDIEIVTEGEPTSAQVFVDYVADGSNAIEAYYKGDVDFIVVGEPAATAQEVRSLTFASTDAQYARRLNAEMNMQTEYGKVSGIDGVDNYPQAGLFVKKALADDKEFVDALFKALDENKNWIDKNADRVSDEAAKIGSASKFPGRSIDRCALDLDRIDAEDAAEILKFLSNVAPSVSWAEKQDALFLIGE